MVASDGPKAEREAAELLRLSDLLDARRSPDEIVPGVYVDEARRRF
ncbi:hypothetical protein [Streptomyces sp. NPDC056669]